MSEWFHGLRFRRDHRWAPGGMSDYLDGELARSRRARMERHVNLCPECRGLLASLRLMLETLHRLPAPDGAAAALEVAASVRLRLGAPPAS